MHIYIFINMRTYMYKIIHIHNTLQHTKHTATHCNTLQHTHCTLPPPPPSPPPPLAPLPPVQKLSKNLKNHHCSHYT